MNMKEQVTSMDPWSSILLFKIRRIGMVGCACLDFYAWGREEKCGADGKLMVW